MSEREKTSFTDDVVAGVLQTDERRGRAFLERLRDRRFGDDWDKTAILCSAVLHRRDLHELPSEHFAALGRVLRGSE